MQGIIIKGVAGFYYVKTENQIYQCKARGIFKKVGIKPAVGDRVEIETFPDSEGVIDEVLPRKNQFNRPFVANVDCFVVVLAVANPAPNPSVTDRFLVMAEKHQTDIVLCINKIDLAVERPEIKIIYQNLYPMVMVSAATGQGISQLREMISGKQAALAGPSGVGKSTILNCLMPSASAEVGALSEKTKRGKHTTRHTELFNLGDNTCIFDTPGFSSFDLLKADEEELQLFYPEMLPYADYCKYDDCRHTKEPDCAVRQAVEEGKIHSSRYGSYLTLLEEVRKKGKGR